MASMLNHVIPVAKCPSPNSETSWDPQRGPPGSISQVSNPNSGWWQIWCLHVSTIWPFLKGKSSINGPFAITMLNYCNCKANYTRREVPKKPKIHSTSTPFLKQFPTHQETPSLQIAEVSILNQPHLSILGWLSGVFMLFKRKEPLKLLKQDQPWTPKRIQCVRTEEVAQGHRFCTITIAIGC